MDINDFTPDQIDQINRTHQANGTYEARRAHCMRLLQERADDEERLRQAKLERIFKATGVRATDPQMPFKGQ